MVMYLSDKAVNVLRALACTLMLVVLAACGDSGPTMSVEEARTAVVASAGGAELKGDALERWLKTAVNAPNQAAGNMLVGIWIDEALLAMAAAEQASAPFDSGPAADSVIEPDALSGAIARFFIARRSRIAPPTDAEVDSLAETNSVRVMQQILFKVPQGTPPSRELQGRVQSLMRRASSGEDFTALVREASEDSVGRENGGYLPAVDKEELVDELETELWPLQPGKVKVVFSPVGVHIVRRVMPEEALPAMKAWLHQKKMTNEETAFRDSIFAAQQLNVADDAKERLRIALLEPVTAPEGSPLVSWKDGGLDGREVQLQLRTLSPSNRAELSAASDSDRSRFAGDLGRRTIMKNIAASSGSITDEARATLMPQYQAALERMRALRASYAQATPAATANAILEAALSGALRHEPLPGALAAVLRGRYKLDVNQAAINALVKDVAANWVQKAAPDSAAPPTSR
jgi:hypothetical protein